LSFAGDPMEVFKLAKSFRRAKILPHRGEI
jgi:hypothetical protein